MLESLKGSGRYFVSWRVLNCVGVGLPQSRPRLYIVGLRRGAIKASAGAGFAWPKKKDLAPLPLKRFLCGGCGVLKATPKRGSAARRQLVKAKRAIKACEGDPSMEPWVVDCNSGREEPSYMLGRLPCLTRTRAACGGHWVTGMGRFLTVEEMLNLMGLPVSFREKGRQAGLSDVQIAQMAGDAIPTNMLMILLARILTKLGLQGC